MKSIGLLGKVEGALAGMREGGVGPGGRILVACSGGPDSSALLLALSELAGRRGLSIVAARVDHGIQSEDEREGERRAVEALCREAGVTLLDLRIEPGLLEQETRRGHRSLEETARVHRLALLRSAARDTGCGLIALGHTADDQAETLVMRFFQGSGPRGLGGIRPRSGDLIRPLLRCTRSEVLEYLARRGRAFHSDPSNLGLRFLRNRVRARLTPVLREVFPGAQSALTSLAAKMSDMADLVDEELGRRDVWTADRGGGFSAEAVAFYALPAALRTESLYRVIDKVTRVRDRRLPYRVLERLVHPGPAAAGPRSLTSERVLRARGIRWRLCRGRILVTAHVVCPRKRGYFTLVADDARSVSRAGPYRLTVRPQATRPGDEPRAIDVGLPGVRRQVVVRSRRRGDRMRTAAGTTSLKKLLSQWGVPLEARDDVAVVADGQGPLAAFALPWGAQVTDRGRAAAGKRITVERTEDKRS